MSNRSPGGQGLHDRVVEAVAVEEERAWPNYRVHRNPGQEKNKAVDVEYPDVVLELQISGEVVSIDEVETDDTVNESAVDQWKSYGALGPAFDLIVPAGSQTTADILIRRHKIRLRALLTWKQRGSSFDFTKVKEY